jgi:hypothetical protein
MARIHSSNRTTFLKCQLIDDNDDDNDDAEEEQQQQRGEEIRRVNEEWSAAYESDTDLPQQPLAQLSHRQSPQLRPQQQPPPPQQVEHQQQHQQPQFQPGRTLSADAAYSGSRGSSRGRGSEQPQVAQQADKRHQKQPLLPQQRSQLPQSQWRPGAASPQVQSCVSLIVLPTSADLSFSFLLCSLRPCHHALPPTVT